MASPRLVRIIAPYVPFLVELLIFCLADDAHHGREYTRDLVVGYNFYPTADSIF